MVNWFRTVPDGLLHLSVLSRGELRSGVARLADGVRKEKLRIWLERETEFYEYRLSLTGGGDW